MTSPERRNVLQLSVERDLERFKQSCDLVVANRMDSDIRDIEAKVFTRDLFGTG